MTTPLLRISGQVDRPGEFSFDDLRSLDAEHQIADVSPIANRPGGAVKLAGVLTACGLQPSAAYLGLHGSADNFHASIPLAPVLDRGLLIYELDGAPLPTAKGGPVRFFIPDHAACHTDEIDECANVKFVDHIELTAEKGFDNRPEDDDEHEALHRNES